MSRTSGSLNDRQKEILREMRFGKQAMSFLMGDRERRAMHQLIAKGWVAAGVAVEDARSRTYYLTQLGNELLEAALEAEENARRSPIKS